MPSFLSYTSLPNSARYAAAVQPSAVYGSGIRRIMPAISRGDHVQMAKAADDLRTLADFRIAVQPVGVLCMKAHTLAKRKRVIQRLGHAVSEGLFLIPPGHQFNGQQLLQRLQLLSPRAGIAQRYGCIFRSGTHAGRD